MYLYIYHKNGFNDRYLKLQLLIIRYILFRLKVILKFILTTSFAINKKKPSLLTFPK
jgi:hypothetical protein